MIQRDRRSRTVGRRTAIACDACRKSKVKCSGVSPCITCQRRSIRCIVSEDSRRILVSERYLNDLHRRAESARRSTPNSPYEEAREEAHEAAPDVAIESPVSLPDSGQNSQNMEVSHEEPVPQTNDQWGENLHTSPFSNPSTFIIDKRYPGTHWLYISQASSVSFIFKVTSMLKEAVNPHSPEEFSIAVDGDSYSLKWNSPATTQRTSDIHGLPPEDYTIYALNAVKFHLGQLLRFFDEEAFAHDVMEFYQNPQAKIAERPLWFVQLLVVLAFGKAFLVPAINRTQPPGFEYFARALSLLPTVPEMQSDPILAVEVLALISLYMYCVDVRGSAYTYLGQAARLAMFSGMHTNIPRMKFGDRLAQHYSGLWWTIYVLDRHLSSACGCPVIIHDSDISADLPNPSTSLQRHAIFELSIKLSRLMSEILHTVYVPDKGMDRSFLERTRSTLKSLANLARELEDTVHRKLQSSVNTDISAVTRITLAYHECAMFATRPILLIILKERLARRSERSHLRCDVSPAAKPLIETCVTSATKTIEILEKRSESSMLETFLPFPLESLFSAATIIHIVDALLPSELKKPGLVSSTSAILEEMISRGNRLARARKRELKHLTRLLWGITSNPDSVPDDAEFHMTPSDVTAQAASQADYGSFQQQASSIETNMTVASENNTAMGSIPASEPIDASGNFLASFGLSSDAIDIVANLMFDGSLVDTETLVLWSEAQGESLNSFI